FSDTNIEYIWKFLKLVNERGWLYKGHRSTEWCPRCGTSLSQHELTQAGVFQDKDDPSLYVRFPLLDRSDPSDRSDSTGRTGQTRPVGESLVIWTTTPWTLPANVAAAVKPDADYGLREGGWRLAEDEDYDRVVKGQELVGLEYEGPFDDLPA